MEFLVKPLMVLLKNRRIILQIAKNDVKARYAGSFGGIFWSVLYPLIFLGCYASVYMFVLKVEFANFDTPTYVAFIFSGLVPFIGFQEAVAAGTGCVLSNINLLKNTMFPIEYIPIKTVISASTTQATGFAMLLVFLVILGKVTYITPFFVILWILQIMMDIGLVWILSALNVIVRDLQNIITIIIMLFMMISPIAYPIDAIPQNFAKFAKFNPMFFAIGCYQRIFIYGELPELSLLIPFLCLALAFFIGGYHFFINMKKVFIDNV